MTLSDKRHNPQDCWVCKEDSFSNIYFEEDLKQEIKELKDDLFQDCRALIHLPSDINTMQEIIEFRFKKRFGDKLT